MRPARKGPENGEVERRGEDPADASMRPARKGPENSWKHPGSGFGLPRFNEAGPQGAGKRGRRSAPAPGSGGFNEAGPQGAGKLG